VHEEVTVHPLVDEHGTVAAFVERHRLLTAASASASPGKLVGRSAPFMRMLELVTRGAPSRSTILLLGESGTGKERVARVRGARLSGIPRPDRSATASAASNSPHMEPGGVQ
jgi:transcriptional regulator with PAS, ATPase and Fis domain